MNMFPYRTSKANLLSNINSYTWPLDNTWFKTNLEISLPFKHIPPNPAKSPCEQKSSALMQIFCDIEIFDRAKNIFPEYNVYHPVSCEASSS